MNANLLNRHFAKIGARAKIRLAPWRQNNVRLDVKTDKGGEFFSLSVPSRRAPELSVLDAQPLQQHLLLMSRDDEGKHKFLCGHDERHWFVAAVPEQAGASSVATAMEALKPRYVRLRQHQLGMKQRKRNRRRNEVFVRQGEWFFVPLPLGMIVNEKVILRNEPLSRGAGKPHIVEELVRDRGVPVYVCSQYPRGLTSRQYESLIRSKPKLRNLAWTLQLRNPQVAVRGKVRHADHKTIRLDDWHMVLMNTENESLAMRHVAFID